MHKHMNGTSGRVPVRRAVKTMPAVQAQARQPPAGAGAAATPPSSPPPAGAGAVSPESGALSPTSSISSQGSGGEMNGNKAVLSSGSHVQVGRRVVTPTKNLLQRRSIPMDAIEEKAEESSHTPKTPKSPRTPSQLPRPVSQKPPLRRKYNSSSPRSPNNSHHHTNGTKFSLSTVESVAYRVLSENLGLVTYRPEESKQMGQTTSVEILEQLQKLSHGDKKLVVLVTVGNLNDQHTVQFGSRCLWNKGVDHFASVKYTNGSLFAVALIYIIDNKQQLS